MTWMLTSQGHEVCLVGAKAADAVFELADVAHALALINRFNGHTKRPYSVAEHSLVVAELAALAGETVDVQFACLMHDAHEAYVGDVISPVKEALARPWADFEAHVCQLVGRRLGVAGLLRQHRQLVRLFDLQALATERRDLMLWEPERHGMWAVLDTPGHKVTPSEDVNLNSPARSQATWQEWRDTFTARAKELAALVKAQKAVVEPEKAAAPAVVAGGEGGAA